MFYFSWFQLLGVIHVISSQELYIHYIHKLLLAVIVVFSLVFIFIVEAVWIDGWTLFNQSLQVG